MKCRKFVVVWMYLNGFDMNPFRVWTVRLKRNQSGNGHVSLDCLADSLEQFFRKRALHLDIADWRIQSKFVALVYVYSLGAAFDSSLGLNAANKDSVDVCKELRR